MDGNVLPTGVIRFVPVGGTHGPKVSLTIQAGRFEAHDDIGPVLGTHRVEIETQDDGGFAMNDEEAFERMRSNPRRVSTFELPARYNRHSRLRAEITAEEPNILEFNLVSARR